jgi:membrane-bound ClpP family serine protease
MPWVIVWPVLVVAALVGAFFLGRDLWRRGKRLAAAAGRASEAAARFSEHADELADEAAARHPVPPVALLRDREELRADLEAARAARDRRLDERHARLRRVMDRWPQHWR